MFDRSPSPVVFAAAAFVGFLGAAACGERNTDDDTSDTAAPVDTEPSETRADVTPDGLDTSDTDDPGALAEALIGPAGGTVRTADGAIALVVPAGALAMPTTISIGARAAPSGAGRIYGAVYRLSPEGLAFQAPATVSFAMPARGARVAVYWTHTDREDRFQALPTTLRGSTASAPIVHFSSVFLGDPTTGPADWFCCEPKDPLTHTDADCIAWSAGAGTTCDTSLCDLSPGACPTDPPAAGCCAPGPTGDEPTQGCASLLTYGQCALGIGAGICDWSASCATATPGCCSALDPNDDNPPIPCALIGAHQDCSAAPKCQWSTSASCPVPPPASAPGGGACVDCADPAFATLPAFIASAQAVVALHAAKGCAQLATIAVAAPSTQAGDPAYAAQLGSFCAYDALLASKGCAAPGPAPTCPGSPASCCTASGANEPPGTTCAAQKDVSACTQTPGGGYCAWNPACALGPGCCAPIDPQDDHPGLPCSQMPDAMECVASLGYGYCQWTAGTGCAPGGDCAFCTDPSTLNDPDFTSAQQSWLAQNTSPTCATLGANPVAPPSAPTGSPAWRTQLGPWCAYQQSLLGKGCTSPQPSCPNLPTDCCFATDPQNDLQPDGCDTLVSQFDCEYQVGLHFCTWNPSCGLGTPTQCCVQIDPAVDEPSVGCAQIPDYGECVISAGFGYCKWDPAAGCPIPSFVACPSCADPAWTSDPDVQTAYVQSFQAYFQGGCQSIYASAVPGPSGAPAASTTGATTYETELGRFCGYEAAFAQLGCPPSFPIVPACPTPPKATTCCSSLLPGIDPAAATCASLQAYGDCTSGTGLGFCQWHAGASCPLPTPPDPCLACADPQISGDPDVSNAATLSLSAYLQAGCGAMTSAPVPPPSVAVDVQAGATTVYETQLGRYCGFEAAVKSAQCAPTAMFAPSCPSIPTPQPCCSHNTPGQQPQGTTCQAQQTFGACTAAAMGGLCQWNSSPLCPLPPNTTCTDCADPAHYQHPSFQAAFTPSYQTYLTNGCSAMAAAPVPVPSAAVGTTLYETQLGRYCGFQQAVTAASCASGVITATCPLDLCTTVPALCPAPVPNCSGCANLAALSGSGFLPAYLQALSAVANGSCLAAQTAGPPAITAPITSGAYGPQAGAYCGYQAAMAQSCNSPGCPATGCADCLDPQYTSDPIFYSALHFGWTRYGAETCADLASLAIPAPAQPPGTAAFKAELGRWCAFELALERNGCGGGSCPGLSSCAPGATSCVLPAPTCADCVAAQSAAQPAFTVAFTQKTAALAGLTCAQAYSTTPPIVSAGPGAAAYLQQLGTWCAYQDQLEAKCGTLYSQCALP